MASVRWARGAPSPGDEAAEGVDGGDTGGARRLGASYRAWLIAGVVAFAPSCDHGIDTERQAPPKATLGDDIYGMMCDRLGASVLAEDLTGASYHAICHYDAEGRYGNTVDESYLPQPKGEAAKEARRLSLAKMARMAAHRTSLIRAFNAAFPDVDIPDPTTASPDDTIRLHDALLAFSQDITPLYETNPYGEGPPMMPDMTDAFGRLFGALEASEPARAALVRIAGRQGYRPPEWGLGAIRTLLAYPAMRPFIQAQLEVLGPNGTATAELQQLLSVVKHELVTTKPDLSLLPTLFVDPQKAQPNRPRSALEFTEALMLDEHPDYLGLAQPAPRYIALRDRRGFVVPLGSTPGMGATLPTPFVDLDGDGFADVDGFGRFVGADGLPLGLATPFWVPGSSSFEADPFGRPVGSPYAYLDTSQTMLAAVARDMVGLVDSTVFAPEGSERPWEQEHETLMYALAGMHILAGPREEAQFDHTAEEIVPAGAPCPIATEPNPVTGEILACTTYQRFRGEDSPLPDLAHGLGQILAHPDSDVILLGLLELVENHTDVVARLMGASLRVKEIADAHDALAAQGKEPLAELAYEVPVWDEMAQIVSDMAQHPGLFAKLLQALADPVVVSTHQQAASIPDPPAKHFGETLAAFMRFRDVYTYDPYDLNGPPINVTDSPPSLRNPHNPVDRTQPLNGDNRSMFERSAKLIYDGTRVRACNKQGAKIFTGVGDIYWPLTGDYDQCELFSFENIGAVYLGANLPTNHPKRTELEILDGTLEGLLGFIGGFTSKDAFLESTSGIDGLTLHPSPQALNRLLFYGAESDQFGKLPDHDAVNEGSDTDKFVKNTMEPVGGLVCQPNANQVHVCSDVDDVLRLRDRGSIFAWERLGFYGYLRPQLKVFAELACNESVTQCNTEDYTGENFFLDLISTLWRHWPGPDHGSDCDHTVAPNHPRYCSAAGINRYEPILAEALEGDLLPALHAFAKVAASVNVTYQRGPKAGQTINGTEIVELLVRILFDQDYAAERGITDRHGNASATWVDGTPQAQVTPYNIFADALHAMDEAFAQSADPEAESRRGKWKRARSLLVDQFLRVEGEGTGARFANPTVPRILSRTLRLLREQLNANCPDREATQSCVWASEELGKKLEGVLSRPVFAALADLTDAVNRHEPARRELERFLGYALTSQDGTDTLFGILASLGDLMQLLENDEVFSPIFHAVSTAANPQGHDEGVGCADRTIQVLKAMSGDSYDRYHILDYVLPALVTPTEGGYAPVQVIADAIADIHREDAGEVAEPLDAADFLYVMKAIREFFVNDTRGFRQLYYIVQNRPKE